MQFVFGKYWGGYMIDVLLYDMQGRSKFQIAVDQASLQITTSDFPVGIYQVVLGLDDGRYAYHKIVKR